MVAPTNRVEAFVKVVEQMGIRDHDTITLKASGLSIKLELDVTLKELRDVVQASRPPD